MEEANLMKGRGICTHHHVTRDRCSRHAGWGTLLNNQNPILDGNVNRKPLGPTAVEWNRKMKQENSI